MRRHHDVVIYQCDSTKQKEKPRFPPSGMEHSGLEYLGIPGVGGGVPQEGPWKDSSLLNGPLMPHLQHMHLQSERGHWHIVMLL